jgi:hypothetical protein
MPGHSPAWPGGGDDLDISRSDFVIPRPPMTLNIAIANYWFVIQASDRRLTLDGKPWDDNANKSLIFGCRDAMLW